MAHFADGKANQNMQKLVMAATAKDWNAQNKENFHKATQSTLARA